MDQSKENFLNKQLSNDLAQNIQMIQHILGNAGDLIIRKSVIGQLDAPFAIVYIKGLVNDDMVNNNLLRMLELNKKNITGRLLDHVYSEMLALTEIKKSSQMQQVIQTVLAGDAALLLENNNEAILLGTSGLVYRNIEEPESESVVRGSRIGFIESFKLNVALLRQEVKDPNLRIDFLEIGTHAHQKIAVCYLDGAVDPSVLAEVKRRIDTFNVDYAPDSGFLEQWLEDNSLSPFPQILDTERPDRIAYNILKGKIGIIVEGTPFALLLPITFSDSLKSIEDYNQRWVISSLLRLIRFISFYMTLFLPALYVALVSYHPELIPSQLLFTITASRESIPFPSLIEALLISFFYEVLVEAGTRLPKKISQTIGIVGGIVIGQIAVMSGIVTPMMVIVISLTGICAFTLPNYSFAIGIRTLRFAAIFAAALLGLYGMILVFIMIYIHLANLQSVGQPYTGTLTAHNIPNVQNMLVRAPVTTLAKTNEQTEGEGNETNA